MPEKVGVTIVGAGVVGCAAARELAAAGREVFVLERNPGVAQGENQSTRNSGVIHAGLYYDQTTRPLKAALCVEGNSLLYRFCREHAVPAMATGKLVAAVSPQDEDSLRLYQQRARDNGVPVEWLSGGQAREREPQVRARAALLLPTSGVVDAAALVHKLYAQASGAGAQFVPHTELAGVTPRPEGLVLRLRYRDGAEDEILSERLVNCAGLYSDRVAAMVDPASPRRIDPVRSEAMKFYRGKRPELGLAGMNVYPAPYQLTTPAGTYFTVGVHLTPTLETDLRGRVSLGPVITVGPLNRPAQGREDYGGDYQPERVFWERVRGFFPGLREEDLEPHQVGIQARLAGEQDWVMEPSPADPRCLNLLGIDSPGLTGSLAIARRVRALLA
jgi:L-2-hydroxyglutarate oxidase LhgO